MLWVHMYMHAHVHMAPLEDSAVAGAHRSRAAGEQDKRCDDSARAEHQRAEAWTLIWIDGASAGLLDDTRIKRRAEAAHKRVDEFLLVTGAELFERPNTRLQLPPKLRIPCEAARASGCTPSQFHDSPPLSGQIVDEALWSR